MNTLEDQLAAYGRQRRGDRTPITADDLMSRPIVVSGAPSRAHTSTDTRVLKVKGPLTAATFAVVTIVLFGLFSIVGTMVGEDRAPAVPATSPTTSPDALLPDVADRFMQAWVARDGEAAAALLTPIAVVDKLDDGDLLPPLHDWYRAVGMEFHARGCVASAEEVDEANGRPLQWVVCAYSQSNKVTRALGLPPSTTSLGLGISSQGIERLDLADLPVVVPKPDYSSSENLDDMFMEWILVNHRDDFEMMFRDEDFGALSFSTPQGLLLWDRYTDEFIAAPDRAARVFEDWQAEAELRAAYLREARAICKSSSTWDEDLNRMLALPPPPDTLTGVILYFYSVAAQLIDLEDRMTAAEGDTDLLSELSSERSHLVHTYGLLIPGCGRGPS